MHNSFFILNKDRIKKWTNDQEIIKSFLNEVSEEEIDVGILLNRILKYKDYDRTLVAFIVSNIHKEVMDIQDIKKKNVILHYAYLMRKLYAKCDAICNYVYVDKERDCPGCKTLPSGLIIKKGSKGEVTLNANDQFVSSSSKIRLTLNPGCQEVILTGNDCVVIAEEKNKARIRLLGKRSIIFINYKGVLDKNTIGVRVSLGSNCIAYYNNVSNESPMNNRDRFENLLLEKNNKFCCIGNKQSLTEI